MINEDNMKNLKVNAFGDVVERGLYDYGNHKSQISFNFEKDYEVVMDQVNIQKMGEFKLKMNELQSEMDEWFAKMDKEIDAVR